MDFKLIVCSMMTTLMRLYMRKTNFSNSDQEAAARHPAFCDLRLWRQGSHDPTSPAHVFSVLTGGSQQA